MSDDFENELLKVLNTKQSNGKTIKENWMTALAKNLLKGDIQTSIFVRNTLNHFEKEKETNNKNELSKNER